MQNGERNDLRWSAFRYVVGEMPDDEPLAFRATIAGRRSGLRCRGTSRGDTGGDPSRFGYRRAVVVERSTRNTFARHPVAWGAVLVTAALLLFYIGRNMPTAPSEREVAATSENIPGGVETVVSLAWADLQHRETLESGASAAPWTTPTDIPTFEDMQSDMNEIEAAPQWLLTAVANGSERIKETP